MLSRQLFLSTRVVTEEEVFHGGVLVDENGVIESVLKKKEVDKILAANDRKIKLVDGGDLVLMSGVVDSHVHVNEPGRTAWEGFRTATSAAAAGGITTIIDMPLNSIPPTTTLDNLKIKAAAAKNNVYVDVGFWGGAVVNNQILGNKICIPGVFTEKDINLLNEFLPELVKAGVVGFKCFLCPSGVEEFPNVGVMDLKKTFLALQGTGSVLAFHAELEDDNTNLKYGDPEEYQTYLESRPASMEINAVSMINNFVDTTDVRVHVVHVSSADVVPLLSDARKRRLERGSKAWRGGVTAETCHHYLSLTAENVPKGHSEYKCAPPIREETNQKRLWKYLLEDKIDMVVSDHSPCTPELKCRDNLKAWGGIASVQFGLSLFWTGASARGLDMRLISKYLSLGPAHLCGLQHRKGALKPGLDADLIFFDPEETFFVTPDLVRHKNKVTPYMGMILKGVVKQTYLRGNLIYIDGDIIGDPKGKLLLNEM